MKTGKVEEYEDGYAVRLIEQGRAIPVPAVAEGKDKADKTARK